MWDAFFTYSAEKERAGRPVCWRPPYGHMGQILCIGTEGTPFVHSLRKPSEIRTITVSVEDAISVSCS